MSDPTPQQPPISAPRRIINLIVSGVFFVLAVLGMILPLLPTTPFLLLTSYFLVRSSPRLHRRLMESKVFGGFLRDWENYRGIKVHVKVMTIFLVVGVVAASLLFGGLPLGLKIFLVVLAIVGIGVVLYLPTIRSETHSNDNGTFYGD